MMIALQNGVQIKDFDGLKKIAEEKADT